MNSGLERIKILASEIKDKATLKIIDYLLTREDMNDKYLNEEKSLTQMIQYIRDNAKKQAENNMAIVEDKEVYSWAIHYFDESNEKLNIGKVEKPIEKSKIEKIEEPVKKETKSKTWVPEGQISLFDL